MESAEGESLSEDNLKRLTEARSEIEDAARFLSTLGEGGWNHGPKIVASVEEAHAQLERASKALAEAATQ